MTTQSDPNKVPTTNFTDTFDKDLPAGQVIGRLNPAGVRRGGIDVEGVISSDHGALRIPPLFRPGWGRAGWSPSRST